MTDMKTDVIDIDDGVIEVTGDSTGVLIEAHHAKSGWKVVLTRREVEELVAALSRLL